MIPMWFHNLCRNNALSWKIEYSEASDHFEVHVWGIGKGEDYYVKKCVRLEDGLAYIVSDMRASGIKFDLSMVPT
jgi:hypothetical protein